MMTMTTVGGVAARNAVIVILAGGLYAILLQYDIRAFTASNHIPAGLPPFQIPDISIYSPSENRTITTGEIFSVSRSIVFIHHIMVAATRQKSNKKKKQKRYSKHNEQLQHYTRTQRFHRSNLVTHFSYK